MSHHVVIFRPARHRMPSHRPSGQLKNLLTATKKIVEESIYVTPPKECRTCPNTRFSPQKTVKILGAAEKPRSVPSNPCLPRIRCPLSFGWPSSRRKCFWPICWPRIFEAKHWVLDLFFTLEQAHQIFMMKNSDIYIYIYDPTCFWFWNGSPISKPMGQSEAKRVVELPDNAFHRSRSMKYVVLMISWYPTRIYIKHTKAGKSMELCFPQYLKVMECHGFTFQNVQILWPATQ